MSLRGAAPRPRQAGGGQGNSGGADRGPLRRAPHLDRRHVPRRGRGRAPPFGLKAKRVHGRRGELVPDEVVIGVVAERLAKDDAVNRRVRPRRVPPHDGPGRGAPAAPRAGRRSTPRSTSTSPPRSCSSASPAGGSASTCGTHVPRERAAQGRTGPATSDGGEVVQREDDTAGGDHRAAGALRAGDRARCSTSTTGSGMLVTVDGVGDPDEVFDRLLDGHRARPGTALTR